MTRSTILRPIGLVSDPNQYGQYPDGALAVAINVCMRRAGIIEPLPAFATYRASALSAGYRFVRLWPGATGLFGVATDDALYELRRITASASTAITFPELVAAGTPLTFAPGKAQMSTHRGRYYFTTEQGVFVLDDVDATEGFLAGFPAPSYIDLVATDTTDAQAIPNLTNANWRALFARKGTDGSFLKIGPPSYPINVENVTGATADYTFRVGWSASIGGGLREGDTVELYRTETQALGTEPGADYRLARTATIAAADLTNGYVEIVDSTPDDSLGATLYTNDSQEGALAAKTPPPYATDLHLYKNHMFYAAPKIIGYLDLAVPGPWGSLTTAVQRKNGIGTRLFTATVTLGSPNLTVVSDTTGLVTGQVVTGAGIPAGTTIVGVNHGSFIVVMSANGTATHVANFTLATDQIEINGLVVSAAHPQIMMQELAAGGSNAQITFNEPLPIDTVGVVEGVSFRIEMAQYAYGVPTAAATHGELYVPDLPPIGLGGPPREGANDERLNRVLWSEADQPEAVPQSNELLIGSGTVYRLFATTDALYVWCSDGLWRLSGEAPEWRVDPIDPTLILGARNCLDIMHQTIFAHTNRGIVAVSESGGVAEVSTGLVSNMGIVYEDTWGRWLTCDETNRDAWSCAIGPFLGSVAVVFNTLSKAFTLVLFNQMNAASPEEVSASTYAPWHPGMMFGNVEAASATDVRRFSTSTKCEGVQVVHQPCMGDADPFNTKQWIDCTWLMEVGTADLGVLPTMNGTEFDPTVVVTVPLPLTGARLDSRGVSGISLNAALGATIEVGWRPVSNATQPWEYKGISLRWRMATEQGPVR